MEPEYSKQTKKEKEEKEDIHSTIHTCPTPVLLPRTHINTCNYYLLVLGFYFGMEYR